jgi:hypothetical protein
MVASIVAASVASLAVTLGLGTAAAQTQASFKIPLVFRNGAVAETLYVGVNGDGPGGSIQDNTIGVDYDAAFGDYKEISKPPTPPPPFAFDARLVTIPGRSGTFPTGLGAGVFTDYRGFESPAQLDSFKVLLQGDDLDVNATEISWPAGLGTYGSVWTMKPQTGTEWPETDMIAIQSLTLPVGVGERRIMILKTGALTSVAEPKDAAVPSQYALHQNFPNPFNPSTRIEFSLRESGLTTLKVYNLLGQEVRTLMQNEMTAAGTYAIPFDATGLPSGIYFYSLTSGAFSDVKKMVLMK